MASLHCTSTVPKLLLTKDGHLCTTCCGTACCSCVVARNFVSYLSSWDIRPYGGPGQADPSCVIVWRIVSEFGAVQSYGSVGEDGTLINLPWYQYASYPSKWFGIQVGCGVSPEYTGDGWPTFWGPLCS